MMNISALAMDFLNRGGKRLRPRLCAAVYRHAAPDGTADLAPICEAIECFHKASLIHDDIQDASETRYGRPALWCSEGVPVAIAVGDWLVAYGYRRLAESGFASASAMLAAAAHSHLRLSEGQGDELLGEGDYLSICSRKTGEAFALAAELGALAAGVDPVVYHAWGLQYGTLFQIRDDRADGDCGRDEPLDALAADFERRLSADALTAPLLKLWEGIA